MTSDGTMSLSKISIVTPSFNQALFIEQSIRSVLGQAYPDIEHIVVDGGSTDRTIEILKRYPHLTWISEPDRGQTHALNKGFAMATGDIVGWLNSDDTYCENIFSDVAKVFENPEVMVVYGHGFEIDENGAVKRPLFSRGISEDNLVKYWKWKCEYVQPAFFFRRAVFKEIGHLDEHLFYVMDYDLLLRLCCRYPFHCLEKPLANFRLYDTSKTGKKILKIIPDWIWELHKVSRRYWGAPTQLRYYTYIFSFSGAILFSVFKNIFFVPGSKSRTFLMHKIWKPSS